MIVIASHNSINGLEYLYRLLENIKTFNIKNHNVCIVDNKSSNDSYLLDLEKQGYITLRNPLRSWPPGAYKYAFDNLQSDVWFCFHDNIILKQNIFELVSPNLTSNNVYTFFKFHADLQVRPDNPMTNFILNKCGSLDYDYGVFGCMIFAHNDVVQKIKNDIPLPVTQDEAQAAERAFGVILKKHNIEIISLIKNYDIEEMIIKDKNEYFTKYFLHRPS